MRRPALYRDQFTARRTGLGTNHASKHALGIPMKPAANSATGDDSHHRMAADTSAYPQGNLEMAPKMNTNDIFGNDRTRMCLFIYLALLVALALPNVALADPGDTITATCGFASSINKILNAVSIIVVTIAIVFSGYQIAFAHKRIGDVAPVLIGAVLIGAAGQIAKMFLTDSTKDSGATACTASLITHILNHYA
jgi:type IV secretion system protein VirB2